MVLQHVPRPEASFGRRFGRRSRRSRQSGICGDSSFGVRKIPTNFHIIDIVYYRFHILSDVSESEIVVAFRLKNQENAVVYWLLPHWLAMVSSPLVLSSLHLSLPPGNTNYDQPGVPKL